MSNAISLTQFKKLFLGGCFGIGLRNRGLNDNHVCLQFLTGDDGTWFLSTNGFSTSWLPEIIKITQEADQWLKDNCVPDIHNGIQYGWKFS